MQQLLQQQMSEPQEQQVSVLAQQQLTQPQPQEQQVQQRQLALVQREQLAQDLAIRLPVPQVPL